MDVVHGWSVQFDIREVAASLFRKLAARADRLLILAIRALPDRQRRTPVALATQRPVHIVLQPVAETTILDVLRRPVDGLIERHQPVPELAGADVPRAARVIQQRGMAAPTEGIGVRVQLGLEQQAARLQILDDERIRILDEHAAPGRDLGQEGAIRRDGHQHRQIELHRRVHILRAKGRRHVHQAGAVFGGDEIAQHHVMRRFIGRHKGEQRLVTLALELLPLE